MTPWCSATVAANADTDDGRLESPAVSRPSNGHGWTVRHSPPAGARIPVPVTVGAESSGAPKVTGGSSRWAP